MKKLIRFLLAGIPGFLVAIALNYALVKYGGISKSISYAITLAIQIIINFFACRYLVFRPDPASNMGKSFLVFMNGIALFRMADWGVYLLLIKLGVPYLAAQIINIALFSVLKFEFSKHVFERS